MIIYDAFSRWGNYKKWEGTYGVEIETETKGEYEVPRFAFWDVHNDGSLRDFGKEYVLKQPLAFGKPLDDALQEFVDKTKGIPFRKDSISTSVHVHVNMLNETFITMANFITVYTLVENILIRYCGPDRKSSLFCLPICDAEETAKNIRAMFQQFDKKNYKYANQFTADTCKYAALNLASLARIGSLEVRSFRGTPDTKEIRDWVGILNSLISFSRQSLTPPEIIKMYHEKGPELLSEIFGEFREQLRYPDEVELVKKTLFWATVNAHCVKDWSRMDTAPKGTVSKKDFDIEAISQKLFGTAFERLSLEQQEAVVHELERLATRPFVNDFGEEFEPNAEVGNDQARRPFQPAAGNWQDLVLQPAQPLQGVRAGRAAPPPPAWDPPVDLDPFGEPEEDDED